MIHSTAIIDPSAKIADDVEIGPYTIIGANVEIGSGTWVGPHVVINGPTQIGKDNKIFQFASIGEIPQDKKYNGEETRLVIGDRNVIREYATMNRGTVDDEGETRIGNDNLFMAYTHVAHDCVIGDRNILANAASLSGHVHVGDQVILGGFAVVHQFVHIGSHGFCGLGSTLTEDQPPYVISRGNPALANGINIEGLKRRGFSKPAIMAIRKAYKTLYTQHADKKESVAAIAALADEVDEVKPFSDFIQASAERNNRTLIRDKNRSRSG